MTRHFPALRGSYPQVRNGRLPKVNDYRTFRFADYVGQGYGRRSRKVKPPPTPVPLLPPPPVAIDTLTRVLTNLKLDVPSLFPMDHNDYYGDCTIAAVAHAMTLWHGMLTTSSASIMNADDVLALYFKMTGGVDSGLNELNVLNYWKANAVNGDEILAYVSVSPSNHTHVKQAIATFGGVYIGFQETENTLGEFFADMPWQPGPLINGGHAVYVTGYDVDGLDCLTWGNSQRGTWAWWDWCVDECYCILPPEAKNTGFAPGFDFTQLQADLFSVGG